MIRGCERHIMKKSVKIIGWFFVLIVSSSLLLQFGGCKRGSAPFFNEMKKER